MVFPQHCLTHVAGACCAGSNSAMKAPALLAIGTREVDSAGHMQQL